RSLGFALMMIILLFLSQVALRPPLRAASAINAAIRALPIGIAFCASAYIFKALKKVPFGKFLIMALLVGLGHGLVVVLSSIRFHQPVALRVVCAMGCEGLLLGGLMGAGFELIDLAAKERKTVEPGLP
ncbi:MAG: hypothetical protein ABIK44_01895, partial [candidate division WOR-3 bacterium]